MRLQGAVLHRNDETVLKTFRVYSGLEYVTGEMASPASDCVLAYMNPPITLES